MIQGEVLGLPKIVPIMFELKLQFDPDRPVPGPPALQRMVGRDSCPSELNPTLDCGSKIYHGRGFFVHVILRIE